MGQTCVQIRNSKIIVSGKNNFLKILGKNNFEKFKILDTVRPQNVFNQTTYVLSLLLDDNEILILTTESHKIEIWKKSENGKFEFF